MENYSCWLELRYFLSSGVTAVIILTACWQVELSLTSGFATESTPLKFDTANWRYFGGFETMWNLMGNWLCFHAILSTSRTIEPQKIRRRPKNSYESFRSILLEISISTVNYRLAPIHELAKWGPRIRTRLWCAAFTYFITRRHLYRKNDHLTVESRLLCRHGSMVSVSLISARCFLLSCGFLSA